MVLVSVWDLLFSVLNFRELLEERSPERPNGVVPAVPKLLQSIIDHNPNVFISPVKPKVVSTYHNSAEC